jgi:RNA polymerase sigma-70 factor (ECF subfamily)
MIAAAPEADTLSEDFEPLFQAHSQLVFRTAYAITGNRQDAEDVLQSVFVNVLQQQGTPSRRSGRQGLAAAVRQQPARYLHRAAVNASLNVIRSRKRRKLVDGIDVHQIPASAGDVRERDERHERLTAALATLTPRALEVLSLRYQHDYTDVQIAAMLGTSRGVIAVTLYRIRTRLRTLLRSTGLKGETT